MKSGLLKRSKRLITRLLKNNKGVTAVEFALVGPVFLAMLLSAVELGLLLTKVALLDNAANSISRSVYTGAVTDGSVMKEDLEETVCDTIKFLDAGCADNLAIELTTISDFTAIPDTEAVCIDSDDPIMPVVSFNPGADNDIVYMRICLTTNVYVPGIGLGLNFSKTETGKLQLVSTLAFSNEPF